MAQFDVHKNPGKQSPHIPFVVVVQSAIFDDFGRRMVVPLVRASDFGRVEEGSFNPSFNVDGIRVVLQPLEMASIATKALGERIASLRDEGTIITDAIDKLITKAFG